MRQIIRINVPHSGSYLRGTIYTDEKIARVSEIFVPKHERGSGYGKMLMEVFESITANILTTPYQISLMSLASAVGFYQKLGYQLSAEYFFEMRKIIISVEEATK